MSCKIRSIISATCDFTTKSDGICHFHLLAAIAQFENRLRHERQVEGIAAAKARGIHFGRQKALTPAQVIQMQVERAYGVRIKDLMSRYHLGKAAVYRYLTQGQQDSAQAAD